MAIAPLTFLRPQHRGSLAEALFQAGRVRLALIMFGAAGVLAVALAGHRSMVS